MYIGADYQKIIDIEKRIHYAILKRTKTTAGFCLPDWLKKGLDVYFAIDNINWLEDTPTGQDTFNGTVVVIMPQHVCAPQYIGASLH